ncbi:MAG TPA: serine/threonine-protein kinase [Opitutaceae bacterium]
MNDPEIQLEQALLDAALGLPNPEARAHFLDRACAGDAALRARLEQLLDDHARAETFFNFTPEIPPAHQAVASPETGTSDSPGAALADSESEPGRIGRYRIVRRLGSGGCGIVYLAEQDEPVRRDVALKLIRLGMDTERVIARFALERQALALMNHPYIARVLDAGATESGRPFFVMELVAGERITDFCDRQRLSLRERLELFILVCQAVQHAHQKGILHRDLKPSNVLVTLQDGTPTPKIIDFGVAKAISDDAEDAGGTIAVDHFIGTPAYMSPEQAEPCRPDVDTRSDLYSLGAMLYELLTGQPPFDTQRLLAAGLDEMRRILREEEPLRPSLRVQRLPAAEQAARAARLGCTPSALLQALHRDLDWIVLQALAKDRQRRYVTVQGLALDLRRYLDDEPVAARPPSALYRLHKSLRRHRLAFSAGAAVLIALVGGLGTSTWLYLREREAVREQMRLRTHAENAEQITRAAYLVRDKKFEEANALLTAIEMSPDRPSYEGCTTYRAVGEWLAMQKRWREVADRFEVVERVAELDTWQSVTLDHQSYGAALLMCGDTAAFERFRAEHARRFAGVTNGEAVQRVLKTCLLLPADTASLAQLRPLGERAEQWVASLAPKRNEWTSIPNALWRYRTGDIQGAEQMARPHAMAGRRSSACTATLRLIVALCEWRQGREAEARTSLETARQVVTDYFAPTRLSGGWADGHWYDWAFAYILLRETEKVVGAPR